jgi:hypothetical protein
MKIIRSYSLDEDVVRFLDSLPDGRGKVMSRGTYVSKAVRMYWLKDMGSEIEELEARSARWSARYTEIKAKGCSSCLWCRLKRLLRQRE